MINLPTLRSTALSAVAAAIATAAIAAAAIATAALGASVAGATPQASTLHVAEGGGSTFPARSLVLTLPSHPSLSAAQVHVSENGKPVTGGVLRPITNAAAGDFGVVLAIDVSPSMRGAPLEQALAAARALAAQRTGMQELAVVTFDRHATVTLPLTHDTRAISQALNRVPNVGSGAYIYNALTVSVQQLASAKIAAGAVILLSDGASSGAKPVPGHLVTASAVGATAAAAHAQIYTVGLLDSSYTPERMRLLARVGGGAFIESNSAELAGVFKQIESQLTEAYVIHYRSLAPLGHRVTVSVHVDGVPQAATLSYQTPPAPRAAAAAPPHRKSFWVSNLALVVFSIAGALMIGLAVLVFLLPRLRAHDLRRRVSQFTLTPRAPEVIPDTEPTTSWALRPFERLLERTSWWARFKTHVEIARIHHSPINLAAWSMLPTVLLAALLGFTLGTPVPSILCLPLGPIALNAIVKRLVQRQRDLFSEQLPTHLQEIASSMRAGHALVPAIASMARGAQEPSADEWGRVVADEQLGVPLENALAPMGERMDSEDIGQVALVASLHSRTGGNMAEVLERVADSVRERSELRRELKALTAQARLSRGVVTLLPIFVGTIIAIINPHYEKALFNTTIGVAALLLAIVLVAVGSLWMRSITNIEV